MNMDWMMPNEEGQTKVLSEVKESIKTADELDINAAGALVTLITLDKLEEHGFMKTNVDLMTEEGKVIGDSLVEKKYPLDAITVMQVLHELFGSAMGENDAMMMTDMILVCHHEGIDKLKEMAEKFEAEEAKKKEEGSEDENSKEEGQDD